MVAQYPYMDPDLPITSFYYTDWLILGRAPQFLKRGNRESLYVVMEDYKVSLTIEGKRFDVVVPAGMTTDLVSVPKMFRSVIGKVGPHLEACIVHDWLYVAWQLQNRMPMRDDWKFANRVLYAGLKAANVSWTTRVGIKIAMETANLSWDVFAQRDKNLFVDLKELRP